MSNYEHQKLFYALSLCTVHYSSLPSLHHSIPKMSRVGHDLSRVGHGLENLQKPLILLACHDVTGWTTSLGGGPGGRSNVQITYRPFPPFSTFFRLFPLHGRV